MRTSSAGRWAKMSKRVWLFSYHQRQSWCCEATVLSPKRSRSLLRSASSFAPPEFIGEWSADERRPYIRLRSSRSGVLRADDLGDRGVEQVVAAHAVEGVHEIGDAHTRLPFLAVVFDHCAAVHHDDALR